jgi:hypothetical protein
MLTLLGAIMLCPINRAVATTLHYSWLDGTSICFGDESSRILRRFAGHAKWRFSAETISVIGTIRYSAWQRIQGQIRAAVRRVHSATPFSRSRLARPSLDGCVERAQRTRLTALNVPIHPHGDGLLQSAARDSCHRRMSPCEDHLTPTPTDGQAPRRLGAAARPLTA